MKEIFYFQSIFNSNFPGNSFSNSIRYKNHLKEIHEVSELQVIQETAALKNSIASNEEFEPVKSE